MCTFFHESYKLKHSLFSKRKNTHFYNNDFNNDLYNIVTVTRYTKNISIKIFYGIHFN